jgi:uncharacterized membrane protein
MMIIIVLWIIPSLLIGSLGNNRTIGFWGAFLISLFLSPVIGLIVTLISRSNKDVMLQNQMMMNQRQQLLNQQQQTSILSQTLTPNKSLDQISIVDELEKLKKLKDEENISEEEYNKIKNKMHSRL